MLLWLAKAVYELLDFLMVLIPGYEKGNPICPKCGEEVPMKKR